MQKWIKPFLETLYAEQNASENTINAYAADLSEFHEYLIKKKTNFTIADRSDIEGYLINLDTRGMAQATRARRLSAVRQLYRFAFEEGLRKDDPAAQIRGPKKRRHLPKTLSEVDVERFIGCCAKNWSHKARSFTQQLSDAVDLCHRDACDRAGVVTRNISARQSRNDFGAWQSW